MTILMVNGKKFDLPEKWNELTSNQLLFISQVFSKNWEKEKASLFFFQNFTNLPFKVIYRIKPIDLAAILQKLNFLHESCQLTKNLFPTIKIKGKTLLGPQDGLFNMVFQQYFEYSEGFYARFLESFDVDWLNWLCGTLYNNGKYIADDIEHNKKLFESVDLVKKYSIFLFYTGCRNFLIQKFKSIFSNTGKSTEPDDLHFYRLLDTLNNNDLSKNESLKNAPLYESMVRLVEMKRQSEEIEKMNNKLK